MLDWLEWMEPHVKDRDSLFDRVAEEGAEHIREHLAALNARYPRHTFRFVQGMGTECVAVKPDIFGDSTLDYVPDYIRLNGKLAFMFERYDAIVNIAALVDDEFSRLEVGDVSADE